MGTTIDAKHFVQRIQEVLNSAENPFTATQQRHIAELVVRIQAKEQLVPSALHAAWEEAGSALFKSREALQNGVAQRETLRDLIELIYNEELAEKVLRSALKERNDSDKLWMYDR